MEKLQGAIIIDMYIYIYMYIYVYIYVYIYIFENHKQVGNCYTEDNE